MLIDTETGRAFKCIPLKNSVVEAVHSAGSTLAVAVARKDAAYHTTEGALLLIDFARGGSPQGSSDKGARRKRR
jgi:hypothetical protein